MAQSFLTLLVCQVLGELFPQMMGLPLSGPIIGMTMLLAWLAVRSGATRELRTSASSLLGYLSLLFVSAAGGVMAYLPALQQQLFPVAVALSVSTVLGMGSAALIMQAVNRRYSTRSARSDV